MSCTICPEQVIWDGVTIVYRKEKILPSLQPPTFTSSETPICDAIHYQPKQQLIQDRDAHQLLWGFLSHQGTTTNAEESGPNSKIVEEKLREINTSLGGLFAEQFGIKDGSQIYCQLFLRVRFRSNTILVVYVDNMGKVLLDAFRGDFKPLTLCECYPPLKSS